MFFAGQDFRILGFGGLGFDLKIIYRSVLYFTVLLLGGIKS
jgi:hypothetical protein